MRSHAAAKPLSVLYRCRYVLHRQDEAALLSLVWQGAFICRTVQHMRWTACVSMIFALLKPFFFYICSSLQPPSMLPGRGVEVVCCSLCGFLLARQKPWSPLEVTQTSATFVTFSLKVVSSSHAAGRLSSVCRASASRTAPQSKMRGSVVN